jgi:hypothetical protein
MSFSSWENLRKKEENSPQFMKDSPKPFGLFRTKIKDILLVRNISKKTRFSEKNDSFLDFMKLFDDHYFIEVNM